MRVISYAAFILIATACDGGSYSNQGAFTDKATDSGTNGDADTDSDSDSDSDSDTDSDSDSDTDTDTDTDTDSDTDTDTDTDPALCENSWYAIHYAPYHRDYDIELNIAQIGGGTGTAYQEDYGTGFDSDGNKVWVMVDQADGGGTGWDGEDYIACTNKKGEEGLFMEEWDMAIGSATLPLAPYAVITPARKIFPAEYEVGGAGSWSYNDTADMTDATLGSFTADSSGTYVEDGYEDVTVKGKTYSAYKLVNTYTVSITTAMGAQVINGQQSLWYVNGLGLVKERNINTDDSSVIVNRDITGFTGLTPI